MSRKGQEVSGNGSRADRKASTADCLSVYKLAACAWPSRAAILETTSVVYKLEIALLATSVDSSAISFLVFAISFFCVNEPQHPCRRTARIAACAVMKSIVGQL